MSRLVDAVEGLNQIFSEDIPKKSIVLVTGSEGTLKSGFTYSLLSNYLTSSGEKGLYIVLEQSKEGHLANMRNMGIPVCRDLVLTDYNDYRESQHPVEFSGLEPIENIREMIQIFKRKVGDSFTCLGLDSLGALYAMMDVSRGDIRLKIFEFFEVLRREGLTSFLILERPEVLSNFQPAGTALGFEGYIADGIVELGIKEHERAVTRFLRVKKMRGVSHSMDSWILKIGDRGPRIITGRMFE